MIRNEDEELLTDFSSNNLYSEPILFEVEITIQKFKSTSFQASIEFLWNLRGGGSNGEISFLAHTFHLQVEEFVYFGSCVGSDGNMSASGSAGPGFNPRRASKFLFENFQPRG